MTATGKNALTRFFIATMVAIIIAIYYFSELRVFEYNSFNEKINQFERHAAKLNSAIVETRFGILKHYDSIDKALMEMKKIILIFQEKIADYPDEAIKKDIDALAATLAKKEQFVLRFKRINPILINAIYQFSTLLSKIIEYEEKIQLTGDYLQQDYPYRLIDKTRHLLREILLYVTLYTNEKHTELTHLIQNIRIAPQKFAHLDEVLAYADKILELQPIISDIDQNLFQVSLEKSLNVLDTTISLSFENYLSRSYTYRTALYLLVFILLVVLRWVFSQLRGTVITLNIEVQRKIKAEKQLEEINRQLEQRVTDRTRELTLKNKDLNQALAHLKEAQDQLIIQEKMASVGILATGIAHEIKNPLNFVNNFSDISVELLSELEKKLNEQKEKLAGEGVSTIEDLIENLKTNCKKIKEHGERADNIVKNMLLHSQESGTQKELINLPALLEDNIKIALQSFRATHRKFDIKLQKHFSPQAKPILAAPQAIARTFIYLIDNALYALLTKQAAASPDYEPILTVHIQQDKNNTIIKIRDNGIGIASKHIDKIFEPFFTTKPTGKGNTGLGLSICYDTIVKQHKGELRVISEEGEFTEFTVVLPMSMKVE